MKEKIILTYNLSSTEVNDVNAAFKTSDITVKKLDVVTKNKVKETNACAIFLGIDTQEDINSFQEKLNIFKKIEVFVVFRQKSFDHLMTAFKNKVDDVFIGDLSIQSIELSKIKLNLVFDDLKDNLPQEEIMDLFSSPLDISSSNHLLFAINNYLENFDSIKKVGILEFDARGIHVRGEIDEQQDFTALSDVVLPERFIGEVVVLSSGEVEIIATPVHREQGMYHWLILEAESSQLDYVLNDLFYRFIENVHLFKKTRASEKSLEVLAGTDDVTGLYNQRKLSEDLQLAIEEHEKQHDNFSIMFIDVDHFKEVNDNHGHIIGSQILTDLGKLLAKILRKSDHIYRYGGDEFVILMPTINVVRVHEVAVRVLNQIKSHRFEIDNNEFYDMSVSIGLAEYPTDANSAKEIIKFADEMMYLSKNAGRGKVFHLKEVKDADISSK